MNINILCTYRSDEYTPAMTILQYDFVCVDNIMDNSVYKIYKNINDFNENLNW